MNSRFQLEEIDPKQDEMAIALLRPDLEELIRENEELGPGKANKQIMLAREMIQKYGLTELEERLNNHALTIAWETLASSFSPILEQDLAENALRDYLADLGDLSVIEQGLRFKRAEDVLRSGRQDILAVDQKDEDVTIELKARPYNRSEVIYEVKKYHGETGNRGIFVAPTIKPDLFFALKDQYDAGRLSFYEVEEVERGTDYRFREITADDFTESDEEKAARVLEQSQRRGRSRQRQTEGVINFRKRNGQSENGNGRPKKKTSKRKKKEKSEAVTQTEPTKQYDPPRPTKLTFELIEERTLEPGETLPDLTPLVGFDGAEAIPTGTFGQPPEDSSYLYKVMVHENIGNENQHNRDRYAGTIYVRQGVKSDLERLLANPGRDTILEMAEIGEKIKLANAIIPDIRAIQFVEKCEKRTEEESQEGILFHASIGSYIRDNADIGAIETSLDRIRRTTSKFNSVHGREQKEYIPMIIDALKNDGVPHKEAEKFVNYVMKRGSPINECRLFETSIERMKALERIDPAIARTYAAHLISTDGQLRDLTGNEEILERLAKTQHIDSYTGQSINIAELDQWFYEQLVANTEEAPDYFFLARHHEIGTEDERRRTLEKRKISRPQLDALEELLMPDQYEKGLERYDQEWDTDMSPIDLKLTRSMPQVASKKELGIGKEGNAAVEEFFNDITSATSNLFKYLSGYNTPVEGPLIPTVEGLEAAVAPVVELSDDIRYTQTPRAKKIKKLVDMMRKKAKGTKNEKLIDYTEKRYDFARSKLLGDFARTKLRRVNALNQIDPTLAQTYMRYSTDTHRILNEPDYELDPKKSLVPGDYPIKDFMMRDQAMYESMLERLTAPERVEIIRESKEQKNGNGHQDKPKTQRKPKSEQISVETRIANGIYNGRERDLAGYEPWITHITEDIASAGYSDSQINQFQSALAEANIARRFRDRDNRPEMGTLELFSQDLMLNYISKRIVPNKDQIRELYPER